MKTCSNPDCLQEWSHLKLGLCRNCYQYYHETGQSRPLEFIQSNLAKQLSQRGNCSNCGIDYKPLADGRCYKCSRYFKHNGAERDPTTRQGFRPGYIASEEARANMSLAGKGRTASEEARANMRLAQKGKTSSDETRAKMSASMKLVWQDPEAAARMTTARVLKLSGSARTTIELLAMATLRSMSYDIQVQVRLGRYAPDIVIPSIKTVVECDGDYWHARPGRKEKDAARNASHEAHGYRVVVLTEAAIRKDCRQALLDAGIITKDNTP